MKTRKSRARPRDDKPVQRVSAVTKARRALTKSPSAKPFSNDGASTRAVTNGSASMLRPPVRLEDPFQARESNNYEEPVPSREMILETLNAQGVQTSNAQLEKLLNIT